MREKGRGRPKLPDSERRMNVSLRMLAREKAELAEAARLLESTLRNDLDSSGVFLVQGPAELSVLTLTGQQIGRAHV